MVQQLGCASHFRAVNEKPVVELNGMHASIAIISMPETLCISQHDTPKARIYILNTVVPKYFSLLEKQDALVKEQHTELSKILSNIEAITILS